MTLLIATDEIAPQPPSMECSCNSQSHLVCPCRLVCLSVVGPWQEVSVTCIVCKYTVNESAFSLPETLQTKYRVTRSVEVNLSKDIQKDTLMYMLLCAVRASPDWKRSAG